MRYHSVIKRSEICINAAKWRNFGSVMLSEKKSQNGQIGRDRKQTWVRGLGGGGDWE